MAYNKAREEQKWKKWKESEEHKLREHGMSEADIQALRQADWECFNSERRYRERRVPLLERSDLPDIGGRQEIDSIQTLLDAIEDERLLHILLAADRKVLQILLLKILGFSVKEIARKAGIPEQTIYSRLNRLKKKIKKVMDSE